MSPYSKDQKSLKKINNKNNNEDDHNDDDDKDGNGDLPCLLTPHSFPPKNNEFGSDNEKTNPNTKISFR